MVLWHELKVSDVLEELQSKKVGLTEKESSARLGEYGENIIVDKSRVSTLTIFLDQFRSTLILILIFAAIVAVLFGNLLDGGLILVIVIANSIFGFVQDYKAEKSIEALKKLSTPKAKVMRDGTIKEIPAKFLVPGDVLVLEEGSKVPADARLFEVHNLSLDESSLTGESAQIGKNTKATGDVALPDRKNMVYMNTDVVRGKGLGVVVNTGMNTEIGKIAKAVTEIKKEETPFQQKINKLGKQIGIAIIIITIVVFFTQLFFHQADLLTLVLIAISLAVAAVPEGLPAVTTLSLALGVKRMGRKKILTRTLPVVEGLGSVDVICSDKTGTITEGKMKIEEIYFDGKIRTSLRNSQARMLAYAGVLCNNATLGQKKGTMLGDPTEKAILAFSIKYANKNEVDKQYKRVDEIPFSSERKMMTTFNVHRGKMFAFTKGAPEAVLQKCTRIYQNGRIMVMNRAMKKEILGRNEEMAKKSLRVLAFAYKEAKNKKEDNLIFLGLEGMGDRPRKGVREAIKTCKRSGIRVIMLTGDNKTTAEAVADEVGISGQTIEGKDLEKMSDEQLEKKIAEANIFARISPLHKVKIIDALRAKGCRIAMTGDGVNDAPALKSADVGVAMGQKGTDVAKETSDIILLDDNFATIVDAVREGRRIFDNIRKFVNYLLSTNLAEVAVVFIASLFGRIPLLAAHLLWINLLTDGMPALALGVDPADPKAMEKKSIKENIIDRKVMYNIVVMGFLMTVVILLIFFFSEPAKAQTMAFTSLVVFELARLQIIRSRYNLGFFSNKYLVAAVIVSLAMQLAVIYTPLSLIFKTVPLNFDDWGIIVAGVGFSSVASWAVLKRINPLRTEYTKKVKEKS